MVELNPTVREQEIYEEMELTPEMVKSIRTLIASIFLRKRSFLPASGTSWKLRLSKLRSCPALTRAWTPARSARPTVGMTMLLCTGKSGTALCHRGGDNTPH